MPEIGAFLSSEEHGPQALLEQAKLAERAGIRSIFISDHFHPWIDRQGESPFVWARHRCNRRMYEAEGDHRRHLPNSQDSSGGPRAGCCDVAAAARRSFCVRCGLRRGTQRTHPR
jgi:hypothetical protein